MRFLIEPVYCMTWIWTLHRDHNKLKSPIEEDNIWASDSAVCVYTVNLPGKNTSSASYCKIRENLLHFTTSLSFDQSELYIVLSKTSIDGMGIGLLGTLPNNSVI